jgi:hypothetical protein
MSFTDPSQRTVLGRCSVAQPNYCRFDPLLFCTEGGWEPVSDSNSMFPDSGKVFGIEHAIFNHGVGGYWSFTTEANTRYEAGRWGDQLLARGLKPALQMIDFSSVTLDDVRRELLEIGLPSSRARPGEAIVRLRGDVCIKTTMSYDASTGLLRARFPRPDDLAVLQYHPDTAAGASVDGIRYVIPGREPYEVVDYVDWSTDSEFLERTLKHIKRVVRTDGRANEFVKLGTDAIGRLGMYLNRLGPPAGIRDPLHRMRARLEGFLPKFKASVDDLDAIVELLEDYRPVEFRISRDVETRKAELDAELRARLEPLVRAEIEAEHETALADIQTIRREVEEAEAKRHDLASRVEIAKNELTAFRRALRDELAMVHDALKDAPAESSSAVNEIARRLAERVSKTSLDLNVLPPATPPWGRTGSKIVTPIGHGELRERLEAEARHAGISTPDFLALDTLLRAGELVVLIEPRDRILLEIYADVVSGGRIRKCVVDASIIGLDDLWRQPGSGNPTPFAKAWTAARAHPDETLVFVLEYLDAAPLSFWLPLLVTELASPDRPSNLLVVGTLMASGNARSEDLRALRASVVPVATIPSAETWMRLALREARREPAPPPTMLDNSRTGSFDVDAASGLISELTTIENLHPDAARRAVRVVAAAGPTMDASDAKRIAVDIGRIASAGEVVPTLIQTQCIVRGRERLHDSMEKTKIQLRGND